MDLPTMTILTRPRRTTRSCCLALGLTLALAFSLPLALATSTTHAQEQTAPPPQITLGKRGDQPRAGIAVQPTLVIVESAAAYAQAISHWTPQLRFPVLIDDGDPLTRQAISRFANGFRPERIIRWTPQDPWVLPPAGAGRRDAINKLQAKAWLIPDEDITQLFGSWVANNWVPPGIVIADDADPAWPAALALGVGRALPIVWVNSLPNPIDHEASPAHAQMLTKAAADWAQEKQIMWDALGDGIDAITICLNDPAKIKVAEGETIALTDAVGRHEDNRRWAWSSQIFGTHAQSAYMAMCSLFIQPREIWIFDSYSSEEPWNLWDGTATAELFNAATIAGKSVFNVTLNDAPNQGLSAWRATSTRGIGGKTGALLLINTKGNAEFFDLNPGRGRQGDIPHLLSPGAVHFVHSWSSLFPSKRETLAGRWFERGAFAYVGSIQEPGLTAFVPTPTVALRLLSQAPWAAAARTIATDPWRIAVFGDALYSVSGEAGRLPDAPLPLTDLGTVIDLAETMKKAGAERDFVTLFETLQLRGEHSRIAQLIEAMLRDRPQEVTASIARAALFAVSTHSSPQTTFDLYAKLDPVEARNGWARDLLWNAARRGVPPQSIRLLMAHVREDQADTDQADLAVLTGGR
jgi:hypothetical protein